MFTIIGVVGWILLDLAMFLTTSPLLPPREWYGFLGAGLVLGIVALLGEIRDRRASAHDRKASEEEIAGLKSALKEAQTQHSYEHDVLAGGNIQILQKLQSVTSTTGAPVGTTIEVASEKIELLEEKVARHEAIFWGAISETEKRRLAGTLAGLGSHTVTIGAHENTDCVELAHDLRDCFRRAGWTVTKVPITGTWGTIGASGFSVTTKNGSERLHRPVFDALQKAIIGPMRGISGGPPSSPPDDRPDISILVGPKRIHAEDD